MPSSTSIPIIVQGNTFSLAIPLQIYQVEDNTMVLVDYTPDPTDQVSIQLKGSRRQYTYAPTIQGNTAFIDLSGNEMADNYGVVVSIVKADGSRLRSFRTDQFFIVESSDDLTTDDIIEGLENNVIYLNSQAFVAGADGRGIDSIVKTGTSGLVDTYTIYYTDNTTSTFNVTNGAQGQDGAEGVGIATINKTSTSGLVDTYTITLTNGETATFQVTNGMDGVDLGAANIVDNLTTGGSTNVLSAEQGKVLNDKLCDTVESQGEETTFNGNNAERIDNKGIINDGSVADNVANRAITPYLEIYPLSTVKFQGYSATNDYGIAFYDANKTFITGSWTGVTGWVQEITAPEGARYVRATLIGGVASSYIKYHPIVTTQVEIIPELEDRIEALENAEVNVVDNLNSSSATDSLSANQGRVIGGCIYTERGATSQTTIGEADATNRNYGIGSDGKPSNTGNLAYSKYTDFTRIAGGSKYMYFSYAPAIGGLAFYTDTNEASFISFVASPDGGSAKSGYVPNNAKYFRVTFTSNIDYFKYYAMQSVPVNQAVDEAMAATQPFIGKRIAILGDSITWLALSTVNYNCGWVTYFREVLKFAELRNYARSGATWSHTANTKYNITEYTESLSDDNVIYNQVNRLINDVDNNGVTAPDFIFILAGTNDAWYPQYRPDAVTDTPASVMSDESVWLNVKSIGSLTSIPKAMRYVAEMIWDKFPDAQVVVTTPLQSTAFTTARREAIAESIKGSANYLSWAVIEQDKVCDITRIRETQGNYMTYDGTHTSAKGAQMVGGIFASLLKALFKK